MKKQYFTHQGMTLVELLVTISIMTLLLAVTVPTFKPMLDSKRTNGAVTVISTALQRARAKAALDGVPCGIEFVRYNDSGDICLQLRLVKAPRELTGNDFTKVNGFAPRVKVEDGDITLYEWTGSNWSAAFFDDDNDGTADNVQAWNNKVNPGDSIKLGDQGRYFTIGSSSQWELDYPYANLDYPYDTSSPEPVNFSIRRGVANNDSGALSLRTALSPMTILPHETMIDMRFSGAECDVTTTPAKLNNFTSNDNLTSDDKTKKRIIMFSPAGHVEAVYGLGYLDPTNGWTNELGGTMINEMIYLCVGEWDHQLMDGQGNPLAEDGLNNIQSSANFWISIHPRTGAVRSAEMTPQSQTDVNAWVNDTSGIVQTRRGLLANLLDNARKSAKLHQTENQ